MGKINSHQRPYAYLQLLQCAPNFQKKLKTFPNALVIGW